MKTILSATESSPAGGLPWPATGIFGDSPETSWSELTSCAGVTPASRSAKLESAAESRTPGIFGRSSPDSFAFFDPDLSCWKTSQATFLLGSDEYSETWPDSGTMRSGRAYELQSLERPICESACSSWPTTTRMEDGESAGNHPGATDSLTGATRNWPTPNVPNGGRTTNTSNRRDDGSKRQVDLASVAPLWRIPDAPGTGGPRNRQGSIGAGHQTTVAEQAEHWQTPAADSFRSRGGDRKDEMGLDQQARFFPSSLQAPAIPDGQPSLPPAPTLRRRLNPRFVEWLMGFDPKWTEL